MNIDSLNSLPVIRDWVLRSEAVLERVDRGDGEVPAAIAANVMLQLEHLMEYDCVASAVASRDLSLQGWVYHFESGQIELLNHTEPRI